MAIGKLMIVDDDDDVRESYKLMLDSQGYNFIEAANGEEAINLIKSEDNLVNVGAILCDIRMPKVNGLECIDFFKKEAPGIPIVVITGYPDADNATSLLKKGCKDYLVKPVAKEKLIDVVGKVIAAGKDTGI